MASTKGMTALLSNHEAMKNFDRDMSHIVAPILSIIYTTSISISISLSIERYMFFCHMHFYITLITYKKIIIWIITLIIFSIIVNIPIFLDLDHAHWFDLLRFLISMLCLIVSKTMTIKEV